jgi:hypothetical protein
MGRGRADRKFCGPPKRLKDILGIGVVKREKATQQAMQVRSKQVYLWILHSPAVIDGVLTEER